MAYEKVESRDDLLTINGFSLEIEGEVIQEAVTVGGFTRNVGEILQADGGTGIQEPFSDQLKGHGPISIAYRVDPTRGEMDKLRAFVDASINKGTRFDFVLIKYNHGNEFFRIPVYRGLFREETLSDFDKNGSGPFEVNLGISIAFWELLPAAV